MWVPAAASRGTVTPIATSVSCCAGMRIGAGSPERSVQPGGRFTCKSNVCSTGEWFKMRSESSASSPDRALCK